MAITYTPEQRKVIELHNGNILVSAAAGSGKTAVLVERIVRMVCDEEHPVDIDRLLVVTFTNAAAAEMKERIAAGIGEKLLEHPESGHLQRQSTLLHNAQITTIDSFSLFLIRNHFNEIGLDPAFRVADEGEVKLLQQEVLEALLEEAYGSGDEDFHYLVEFFCPGGREAVLEQHILNLVRLAESFPWVEEWLEARKGDYSAADVNGLLAEGCCVWLQKHLGAVLAGCGDKLREALELCGCPDGPYMYAGLIEKELEQIEGIRGGGSLVEYGEGIASVTFGRLPSKKDESVSPLKRELVKALRSEVKDSLEKTAEQFFATPLELAAQQGHACDKPVRLLLELALEFYRRMQAKKREKKLVDFSDMEHYALEILVERDGNAASDICPTAVASKSGTNNAASDICPTAVALEYRQYFHEILVDEYQDSNLVQEYLLQVLSGEEEGHFNRFMVGDVKQSIYKFRLARPEIFLQKYDSYSAEGTDCRRIDLAKNFRSRTEVVRTVNDVFSRLMSKEIGGIDYDERAALYEGAVYPEGTGYGSELLLVEKSGKEEPMDAREAEALGIAHRIKELKGSLQVTDKGTGELRPLCYSDCVILLRTTSGWDEVFKRVLEEQGIPAYIASKTGYFAALEVQELLQVLRVLDNPRQDIPLFGMMKSVFGGFSEEEIALIRGCRKEGTLYEAVVEYARGEEGASDGTLCEKARAFLEKVEGYRDCTVYLPVRELLQKLVEDFDYLDYVTALPGGGRRRANVEMLFTKASDFEKTSYFGLFHFIRYMEQLEKYDVDFGEAGLLDENADVVRIMSIHKSKGLEFPVVFVAGLAKRFNMQDASQALIVDMDLGLGTDYVDPDRRLRNRTLRRSILARKMREDNLAEELRVLYVAFTRAKEKLILTAALENASGKWEMAQERGAGRLAYIDFMEAGSYLDFLLPILKQTCVEVQVMDGADLAGAGLREQVQLYGKRSLLERAGQFADPEGLARLEQRFSAVYPFENLAGLYTKTTVSELKIASMADKDEAAYHAFEEKEVVPYIPAFRRGQEKVSGTVRGNAFHRAMELLDFEAVPGKILGGCPESYGEYAGALKARENDLKAFLHAFLLGETASRRLTEEYFQALSEDKLVHFLETPLAWRMWRADARGELYREQPFVLGLSADRLRKDFPESETVLIQGIIDVFFIEEGKLVLLDYKTDIIQSMEELWNRYEVQLDYYEEALVRLWRLPMKEKLLYSFYLEEEGCRS